MSDRVTEIDKKIKECKEGNRILQNYFDGLCTFLVYVCDDFFLETYRNFELLGVECVSEEVARFSLTARYKG